MAAQQRGMRVAVLGGYPPDPAVIRGGVQAASAYLVKGLARIDGLEVHVLTLRDAAYRGPECIEQDGATIHLLPPYPRFERLRGYRNYQAACQRVLDGLKPDIVHAQEATASALVALRSGYPTLVTAHGIRREDARYAQRAGQRLRLLTDALLVERRVMRRVKHLVAISRYITSYFRGVLPKDARLYYIPNAVDERFFDLPDTSTPDHPVILYAGRVTSLKRVKDLVEAFARAAGGCPGAELRLAGECASEPEYVEMTRRAAAAAGLAERVRFLGQLDQAAVLREYAACSLVALPSAQENAPLALAQAMAAGKAVLATRVGGVPEMTGLNEERGLLAPVGDVPALAAALARLLQDASLRRRLGQAGLAFAREQYRLDRVAARTAAVYHEILTTEASPHA